VNQATVPPLAKWYLWLGVLVVLAGCSKQGETAGSAGPEKQPQAAGAPGTPWADKDRQARLEYMGLVVLPRMKSLFQEVDPKSYADFRCQTCHGEDMDAVDFVMPNSLVGLSAADPIEDGKGYDEATTEFMMSKVVPTMAGLLDRPPAGPEKLDGFGCFGCHQKE
jgi:hypothetical protein